MGIALGLTDKWLGAQDLLKRRWCCSAVCALLVVAGCSDRNDGQSREPAESISSAGEGAAGAKQAQAVEKDDAASAGQSSSDDGSQGGASGGAPDSMLNQGGAAPLANDNIVTGGGSSAEGGEAGVGIMAGAGDTSLSGGAAAVEPEVCLGDTIRCDEACVSVATDSEHCGACSNVCQANTVCQGGQCVCGPELAACGGSCIDVMSDAANCGACDAGCSEGFNCELGACVCAVGLEVCGGQCVDMGADTNHCGACDAACQATYECSAGECACAAGSQECSGSCVDTQADGAHCGQCDAACGAEQACEAGECVCPEGRSQCGDTCIDVNADDLNCGECGLECDFGANCSAGVCKNGAAGDDGCGQLAGGVTLRDVSIYQTVKVPLMQDGLTVERDMPVVSAKQGLVRVLFDVASTFVPRELSARLLWDNNGDRRRIYSESTLLVEGSSVESKRDTTFEFVLPAEMIGSQVNYAIEIVECGEPGEVSLSPRYPNSGGEPLGAIVNGGLRLHIVPLLVNGLLPDTTAEELDKYRQIFLATYPIDSVDITVGEPLDVVDDQDWETMIEDVRQRRTSEAPDDAVYYYGMLRPTERVQDYCAEGCIGGVGYVPVSGSFFDPSGRVAVGLAYNDEESYTTALHEVGHNHGLRHAPCVPPGNTIENVDVNYPYEEGNVGVYGWDARSDRLMPPSSSDIMAYCPSPWLSDYAYNNLNSTVQSVNSIQLRRSVAPARVGAFSVLLVSATGRTRWGYPMPDGARASGARESAVVFAKDGTAVATVDVYRTRISEIGAYRVVVPAPKNGWHAIALIDTARVPF